MTILLYVPLAGGCDRPSTLDRDQPAAVESPVAVLSELQQQALGDMRRAGARVEIDRRGWPTLIDMASDRVSADMKLLQAAACFPGVKSLRLAVNNVTSEALGQLSVFRDLEELLLQDAPISNAALADLVRANPGLRRVTLRRLSSITDDGLQALSSCPNIEVVALIEMNQISGAAIKQLRGLSKIRSLDLRNSGQLGQEDFRLLAGWQGLADLKIGGPAVDDGVLALVADLPALQSLTVEDAEITNTGLAELAAGGRPARFLTSLTLARCYGITDEGLEMIGKLSKLTQLALRDLSVTGSFLTELAKRNPSGLPLTRLTLTNSYVTDEVTVCFAELFPRLEQLDLRGNLGITDVSARRIQKLPSLVQLRLEETGVTSPSPAADRL